MNQPEPYVFREFPKFKYLGLAATLVHNPEEEAALGEGYTDAPVDTPPAPAVDPRDALIAELKAKLEAAQQPAAQSSEPSAPAPAPTGTKAAAAKKTAAPAGTQGKAEEQ